MAGFLQAGISRFLFAFCMILSFVLPVLLLPSAPARAELYETPSLAAQVASGTLPPVSIRLPNEPALAELETIGRPGGELRMLMSSPKDTRLMVVYGYARLVAYTPALAIVPDMLERPELEAVKRTNERLAQLGQLIIDPWRNGRGDGAADQAVALEVT